MDLLCYIYVILLNFSSYKFIVNIVLYLIFKLNLRYKEWPAKLFTNVQINTLVINQYVIYFGYINFIFNFICFLII